MLSHFSRIRLCATPSLGFSRQEHWSGLPFPSPMHKSEKWKRSPSVVSWLLATPWTAAYQAPPSMGFSRQEYWSGVPLPSPVQSNSLWYLGTRGEFLIIILCACQIFLRHWIQFRHYKDWHRELEGEDENNKRLKNRPSENMQKTRDFCLKRRLKY